MRVTPTGRAPSTAPSINGMDRGPSHTPLLGAAAGLGSSAPPPIKPGTPKGSRVGTPKSSGGGSSAFCGRGGRDHDVEEAKPALASSEKADVQENYIPFRFADLRDKLMADHPAFFPADDAAVTSFKKFGRWLNLRNQATLALQYQHMDEAYTLLDPDVDRDGPPVGGKNAAGDPNFIAERQRLIAEFTEGLEGVLAVGEFDAVTEAELALAYKEDGPNGLAVTPFDPAVMSVKLYWRGKRMEEVTYSSWRTLYLPRTKEMQVYQRLVMTYHLRPEAEAEYKKGLLRAPWYRRLWRCLTCQTCQSDVTKVRNNGMQLGSNFFYMKMFKDIQLADVDMLIPGATIKFTWVDWAIVVVPLKAGVAFATYKAATGKLYFSTLTLIAASLVLILGPLLYAWTAYMNILAKEAKYAAYINQLVLMHNICNNESVLYQLLDEAQEQDDNEALLAYFFLWTMQQEPSSKTPGLVSQWDLETRVEEFLQKSILEHSELDKVEIDFDVTGAVCKLRMYQMLTEDKLVGQTEDQGRNRMLSVKPLVEAEKLAHLRNFDETREVNGLTLGSGTMARRGLSAAMRNNAIAGFPTPPMSPMPNYAPQQPPPWGTPVVPEPVWKEAYSVHTNTGQRFRYFWNSETHQSTYDPPPSFTPFQDTSGGGAALPAPSEPQQQQPQPQQLSQPQQQQQQQQQVLQPPPHQLLQPLPQATPLMPGVVPGSPSGMPPPLAPFDALPSPLAQSGSSGMSLKATLPRLTPMRQSAPKPFPQPLSGGGAGAFPAAFGAAAAAPPTTSQTDQHLPPLNLHGHLPPPLAGPPAHGGAGAAAVSEPVTAALEQPPPPPALALPKHRGGQQGAGAGGVAGDGAAAAPHGGSVRTGQDRR